ncbi:MAG TPA: protein translocase subunit SecF, partial [Sutterella sp.]|nr:protein translocase subunit SecF [Sutterella sp.]
MEFFRIRKTIPFMKYSLVLNLISLVSFFVAVGLILFKGLAFSIEFTGGTVMEVGYPQAAPTEVIRESISNRLGIEASVQNFGTARDVVIRLPSVAGKASGQQANEVM